jgi:hypothetical protein
MCLRGKHCHMHWNRLVCRNWRPALAAPFEPTVAKNCWVGRQHQLFQWGLLLQVYFADFGRARLGHSRPLCQPIPKKPKASRKYPPRLALTSTHYYQTTPHSPPPSNPTPAPWPCQTPAEGHRGGSSVRRRSHQSKAPWPLAGGLQWPAFHRRSRSAAVQPT